ncbi:hypothetical protein [Streptomyces sp. Ncost-T10-10d]|uniref:hypothetical protein n=1 Tax=Streptomyces sp. Ncost-T10-10d TaxID=1839774 RepID=UPI00081E6CBD|nr:hypothetical protein GA0115254_109629 [Streptomyces sp. Ncost-T10-10d]
MGYRERHRLPLNRLTGTVQAGEPLVVALVQPDGRLIQHVQHAGQPCSDLGRQSDPLRLPAGKGSSGPVEGEVVQADVEQEAQPLADL